MNLKLQEILENQRVHWNNTVQELIAGYKQTHWCWYFLPNVPKLGTSVQSQKFAVTVEEFIDFMQNSEYAGNINIVLYLIDRAHRISNGNPLLYILGHNPIDVLKWNSFVTLYRLCYTAGKTEASNEIAGILLNSRHCYDTCTITEQQFNHYTENYNG